MDWMGLKGLAEAVAVQKDALHIYAGFLIQVLAALLFRRPLGHWLPWVAVLGVELANEAMDFRFGEEARYQEWQWLGARHDLINTMILPTLLLLLCRYAPGLFKPAAARAMAAPTDERP